MITVLPGRVPETRTCGSAGGLDHRGVEYELSPRLEARHLLAPPGGSGSERRQRLSAGPAAVPQQECWFPGGVTQVSASRRGPPCGGPAPVVTDGHARSMARPWADSQSFLPI